MENPFQQINERLEAIGLEIQQLRKQQESFLPTLEDDSSNPLDEYIPRRQIVDGLENGKLVRRNLSKNIAYRLQREGKLNLYEIGGKYYYKKTELAHLPIKRKIQKRIL